MYHLCIICQGILPCTGSSGGELKQLLSSFDQTRPNNPGVTASQASRRIMPSRQICRDPLDMRGKAWVWVQLCTGNSPGAPAFSRRAFGGPHAGALQPDVPRFPQMCSALCVEWSTLCGLSSDLKMGMRPKIKASAACVDTDCTVISYEAQRLVSCEHGIHLADLALHIFARPHSMQS